ncbi:MAG: hypothetical protein HYY76_17855 [Acidobacteria bacterium]|nr:hypothetical protein [Acidobacteriota bacterium]
MAIVKFHETFLGPFGTINTAGSFSAQHNFKSPVTVWSRPYLQSVFVHDVVGGVDVWVSQYKDQNGTNNVAFSGVFAKKCTSITFNMYTKDCIAIAVLTSEIFG